MAGRKFRIAILALLLLMPAIVAAEEGTTGGAGDIITFWPLFDYRESPREGFSNLAILGPLFKFQRHGPDRQLAVRPFYYHTVDVKNDSSATDYLYPLMSTSESKDDSSLQLLRGLINRRVDHKAEGGKREESAMFFPFYISGKSEKYGEYTSVFPFYGDIYERFWRDEYHFFMFPLYGRTVNKGTTTTNVLYPFFSTVSGERENGFQFWPLYGQAAKEGVYRRRFILWPFFSRVDSGLDTENAASKLLIFPFYGSTDGPKQTARTYLWPFFGYRFDTALKEEERDYFWPFWVTASGPERNVIRFIPFYAEDKGAGIEKQWYMWPLYRRDSIDSSFFRQERDRILYFLYSDNRESWPMDGTDRRRTALWPLFLYNRDVKGVRSLSIPAPVEPVFDNEGIEKSWAPFWRIYQQRWNEGGDSAVSFLWNLYWHEVRGDEVAYELFPFVFYRNEKKQTDISILKGLIRYRNGNDDGSLTFFWLPFGPHWGKGDDMKGVAGPELSGRERNERN